MNRDCVRCGVKATQLHIRLEHLYEGSSMRQTMRFADTAKQVPLRALALLAASAAFLYASTDAHPWMRGKGAAAISRHVVKLVGHNLLCSATVIGRQQLLTANHCVENGGPFFLVAGGTPIPARSP